MSQRQLEILILVRISSYEQFQIFDRAGALPRRNQGVSRELMKPSLVRKEHREMP